MNNKIISLIERNADNELKAYFESLTSEHPLDLHEELVLLEHFSPAAVKSYINRFRFSKDAEKVFVQIAPADIRLTYLNYYGLTEKLAVGSVTNMYAIVEKLTHAGNVVKP